ncbi:O-antigen ligase family protein [Candidatus Sumerlaeota bacterium]|nr:O-antigen ligase family protein [Candidatus Sumerlaeota bacterium]
MPSNSVFMPDSRRRFLASFHWLFLAACVLFAAETCLWPPETHPRLDWITTLGMRTALLACVLLLAEFPVRSRGALIVMGAYALLTAWLAWSARRSPMAFDGMRQLGMWLEGGVYLCVGLALPRPITRWIEDYQRTHKKKKHHAREDAGTNLFGLPDVSLQGMALGIVALLSLLGLALALDGWWQAFVKFNRMYQDAMQMVREQGRSYELDAIIFALSEKRATGPFGNPNVYCAQLAALLPCAFALLALSRTAAWRLIAALTITATFYAGALSGSRGGMLCLLLALALGLLIMGRKAILIYKWHWLGAIGAALLLAIFARPQKLEPMPEYGMEAPETALDVAAETETAMAVDQPPQKTGGLLSRLKDVATVRERLLYWQSTLGMIREAPLDGHGLGSFVLLYQRFKEPEAREVRDAHNILLQYWAEAGLIGVLLLVGWIAAMAITGLRALYTASLEAKIAGGACLAAGAIFLFDAMFDISYLVIFRQFFYLVCLLSGAAIALGESGKSTPLATPEAAPTPWPKRPIVLANIAALAVLTLLWWPITAKPARAADHIEWAGYLRDAGKYDEAVREYRRAMMLTPGDVEIYRDLATLQAAIGAPKYALEHIEQALGLAPELAPLWRDKARYEQRLSLWNDAETSIQRAIELYPLRAEYLQQLAEIYAAQKKWPLALAAQREAVEKAWPEVKPRFLEQLHTLLLESGDKPGAIEALQQAYALAQDQYKPRYARLLNQLQME